MMTTAIKQNFVRVAIFLLIGIFLSRPLLLHTGKDQENPREGWECMGRKCSGHFFISGTIPK